jgi:hypothetical protein
LSSFETSFTVAKAISVIVPLRLRHQMLKNIAELAGSFAAEVGGILKCGTERPSPDRVAGPDGLEVFIVVSHQVEGEE